MFKFGDKVVCLNDCEPGHQFTKGAVYVVKSVSEYCVTVVADDAGVDNGWSASNFELLSNHYDNADTTAQDAIEGRNMQHTDVINGVVEEALNLMGDEQSSLDETSSYEETVGGDNTHITFTFSDHDAEESREASFYLHGTKANTLADVLTTFKMFLNAAGFTYVDGLVAYGNEGEVSSR